MAYNCHWSHNSFTGLGFCSGKNDSMVQCLGGMGYVVNIERFHHEDTHGNTQLKSFYVFTKRAGKVSEF